MEIKVITISREFGAGGRTVGHMVAEKLGIPFYDKALVEQVAQESGFSPKYIEEHGERAPGKSVFSYAFAPQGVPGVMNGLSSADYLWNVQCDVILQLADQGPCVIVGRNADYILKDRPDVLHVFLHADLEHRRTRIVEVYGEPDRKTDERIAEHDKRRSLNYQHFTGRSWGESRNYHLCMDTGVLGFEQTAQIIVNAVNRSRV